MQHVTFSLENSYQNLKTQCIKKVEIECGNSAFTSIHKLDLFCGISLLSISRNLLYEIDFGQEESLYSPIACLQYNSNLKKKHTLKIKQFFFTFSQNIMKGNKIGAKLEKNNIKGFYY